MALRRLTASDLQARPLPSHRLDLQAGESEAAAVREIVKRVAREGDAALLEYGRRFDGWAPSAAETLQVPSQEVDAALRRLPSEERSALELVAERIRRFHEAQAQANVSEVDGLKLLTRAVERAGLYIPGGRAAYPSTVLMTVIPARVAGVGEILLATPPSADGTVADAILAAAVIAGADAIYRIGGAQAIAALAYGTASVPRADVIAGPGNIYVTLAKKEVFGAVGVDAIAGPTELLIVADGSARPDHVAADLASQLEHDPMAWALLLTDSPVLADAVEAEFAAVVATLERAEVVASANCSIVLVESLDQAMQLSNDFAPEHLEIIAKDAARLLGLVKNAGAVFVGPHTPVSLGDYAIGPNHTLPTSGSARFGSPLGVYTFLKRTSVAALTAAELDELQEAARTLARLEGLTAHAKAIEVRLTRGEPTGAGQAMADE